MKFDFSRFLQKVGLGVLVNLTQKGKVSAADAVQVVGGAAVEEVAESNPDRTQPPAQ